MPNKYQVAYLGSFLLTLSFLIAVSRWVTNKLSEAGYPISNLILIGLDDKSHEMSNTPSFADVLRAVEVPGLGKVDLVSLTGSPVFIVTASIIFATAVYATLFSKGRSKPLDPNAWKEFPLEKKIQVSPNTAIYRFKLPYRDDVLGLPIGQHISISAEINGKNIIRNYTPISLDDDQGYFELIIKTYEKGNISKHVSLLSPGQKIRVKGPKGAFLYTPNLVSHISMIAGGTGIAPMMQVLRACLRNPQDRTTITLIYANVNEEDILLRKDLEDLQAAHAKRFKLFYVLNNPPAVWNGGKGFVTKEHIQEHLPNPLEVNSKLLICGPPPMIAAMKKNLEEIKYPVPNTISKLHDKAFVF